MFTHGYYLYITMEIHISEQKYHRYVKICWSPPSPSAVISSDFKFQLWPKCTSSNNFSSCFYWSKKM